MIKNTLLPLPPLEEQAETVRRAATALALADRIAVQIEQVGEALDHVSRSALAKAFRGELVPAGELIPNGSRDSAADR